MKVSKAKKSNENERMDLIQDEMLVGQHSSHIIPIKQVKKLSNGHHEVSIGSAFHFFNL